MPPADQNHAENILLRLLCYGPAKVKKTWWALNAVKAGFNVLLLDADGGNQIITQMKLDELELARINVINIVDKQDHPVACHFVTRFLIGNPFMWDEQDKSVLLRTASALAAHNHYIFDPKKLTHNDVVIFDSWDAITWSLAWRWYTENGVKVESADQAKTSDKLWPGYRWSGAMASWMLKQIKALSNQCHVIVIGHQSVYEKRHEEIVGGKTKQVIDWSRTQVKSTSGPHGMELASAFTDIPYFNVIGSRFTIDTRVESDRDGGCTVMPSGSFKWEDLQFGDVIEKAGIRPADIKAPLEAAIWYPSGVDLPEGKVITQGTEGEPLEATKPSKSGFAGLLALKSGGN